MGLFSWVDRRFSLTERQRKIITQVFGSFAANQFAINDLALIKNSYEKNTEVFSLIKKIIDVSKSVPWIVEQRQYNGNWKVLENTSLHALMESPNVTKKYCWGDIDEQVLLFLLCTGNGYLYTETGFGASSINEVDVLPSQFVDIESNENFFMPEYKYRFDFGNKRRVIEQEQVCHIKFFRPAYNTVEESLYGLSPIEVAAAAIQVGNDRWEADANLLQNRGAIGLISDKSQKPMSPEQSDKVQLAFDEKTSGPGKFGKVVVTNKDLNYIQMAMSPADLQLIEKGVVNLRSLCNVFGMDSSLFNDPENKTYSNRTEAEKSMFTNAIIPLSMKRSENYTRMLCNSHFPGKTVRMRQDFSKVECLQENFKEKSAVWVSLKKEGIYTANEVRTKLGDDKSTDNNADKLIISSSASLQSSLGEQQQQPAASQQPNT